MLIFTDPHGCFKTFKKLYEHVTALFPGEEVVIAGDLPDRGPNTRDLIQFVIDNKIKCIKGNHDDFMSDPNSQDLWQMNGGDRAKESYRKPDGTFDLVTLEQHKEFLKSLPFYVERPDLKHENGRHLLITHAPVGQGKLENQINKTDSWGNLQFIWNRDRAARNNKQWFNVHGHNPCPYSPDITDWYANIDTGCAYKRPYSEAYGKLTCLRFPSMEIFQQPNVESEAT